MLVSSSVVGHPYRNKERIIPLPDTPYIYETARAARRGAAWRGVTAPARGGLARGSLARGGLARGSLARGSLARGSLARGSLARGSLARRRGGRPGTTRLQRQPGTRPQHARRQLPAHDLLGQPRRPDQRAQVDPGLEAHVVQHVHHLFGGDVAAGPRRV